MTQHSVRSEATPAAQFASRGDELKCSIHFCIVSYICTELHDYTTVQHSTVVKARVCSEQMYCTSERHSRHLALACLRHEQSTMHSVGRKESFAAEHSERLHVRDTAEQS